MFYSILFVDLVVAIFRISVKIRKARLSDKDVAVFGYGIKVSMNQLFIPV